MNKFDEASEAFPHAKIDEAALEYRERVLDWFEDYCQTIEDALTQAAEIERGDKVVVPREPTRIMYAAMGDAVVKLNQPVHHDIIIDAVYKAMITAAEKGNDDD